MQQVTHRNYFYIIKEQGTNVEPNPNAKATSHVLLKYNAQGTIRRVLLKYNACGTTRRVLLKDNAWGTTRCVLLKYNILGTTRRVFLRCNAQDATRRVFLRYNAQALLQICAPKCNFYPVPSVNVATYPLRRTSYNESKQLGAVDRV